MKAFFTIQQLQIYIKIPIPCIDTGKKTNEGDIILTHSMY